METINIGSAQFKLDELPNNCPWCGTTVKPEYTGGAIAYNKPNSTAMLVIQAPLQCPSKKCLRLFLATFLRLDGHPDYKFLDNYYKHHSTAPRYIKPRDFDQEITNLSQRFVEVYQEAETAKQYGLLEIAGPGFRKAFEILIKDYLISQYPAEIDKIKKNHKLQNLISEKITDEMLKEAATRAGWLGNDETHYEKTWINKDISDLLSLIDIAIHSIANNIKLKNFIQDMPK